MYGNNGANGRPARIEQYIPGQGWCNAGGITYSDIGTRMAVESLKFATSDRDRPGTWRVVDAQTGAILEIV